MRVLINNEKIIEAEAETEDETIVEPTGDKTEKLAEGLSTATTLAEVRSVAKDVLGGADD